jgi:hypothetical protein
MLTFEHLWTLDIVVGWYGKAETRAGGRAVSGAAWCPTAWSKLSSGCVQAQDPKKKIFSNVSALVHLLHTGTGEGTFENVCLRAAQDPHENTPRR